MERQELGLEHLSEKETLERRNLVLSLENAMLRLERRLPAGDQQSGGELEEIRRRLDALEKDTAALRQRLEKSGE